MTSRAWVFAFFAAAFAVPAACTFPTVTFDTGSTSSSGSGSNGGGSGNPTSGGTNTTQNTGGVGPGGLGGAGGMNSGGGVTTAGGGFGGSSSDPCPGAPDPCDCDNDGHRRPSCPGTGGMKPADDCADHDSRAFPGQMKFFSTPIMGPVEAGTLDYDFNCDGFNTQEWPDQITCGIGIACNTGEGWKDAAIPDCGQPGTIIKCSGLCSKTTVGMTNQPCN